MHKTLILTLAAATTLSACAASPNTTRGAMTGAALGAAAGAVIGNNTGDGEAQTGALVGAAVGGAAGAAAGCERDRACPWHRNSNAHSELRYDQRADRYYFMNYNNNCTYWRDGTPRGCR